MMAHFAPAARAFNTLLQQTAATLDIPLRFALIGGLAVSAWGPVRATQDIDVLADSDPSPIQNRPLRTRFSEFWETRGYRSEWRAGMADDPIALLTQVRFPLPGAFTVDILWAQKQWQREALLRAVLVRVARSRMLVLHPEDLILMKLEAGSPQDLLDVEGILAAAPPELNSERLKQAAARLRLTGLLNKCLRHTA